VHIDLNYHFVQYSISVISANILTYYERLTGILCYTR